MSSIQIDLVGRRYYLVGNTYPIKERLRDAGCKWDGQRKAWWTGKRETAVALVESTPAPGTESQPDSRPDGERQAPGAKAIVAARATYQGKTYYVLGRVERGRTHWDDTVAPIHTRDGEKMLLSFRDGSKSFWAARAAIQIVKSYQRPTTIERLREFADQAKMFGGDGCSCRCHSEPGAGGPGSTLYDGCDRCGCEAC